MTGRSECWLPRRGIILAGGRGTRLYPATCVVNKHLLAIVDRPMIFHPLATLIAGGVTEILLVSSPDDLPQFRRLLGDGRRWGVSIAYVEQSAPRGIADVFHIGADFIGDAPVCVILGDNVFDGALIDAGPPTPMLPDGATVFAREVPDPRGFGVVELDAEGRPVALQEKPTRPSSAWAVTGLYVYGPGVRALAMDITPSARGELEITALNRRYLEQGRLRVAFLDEGTFWRDAGTPEGLAAATAHAATAAPTLGCPATAAWRQGRIDAAGLRALAREAAGSDYGAHLEALAGIAEAGAAGDGSATTRPTASPEWLPEVLSNPDLVTVADGRRLRVVALNNAATTPPLVHTMTAVHEFMRSYGALHRGAGPRARQTVEAVQAAVTTIRGFLGCPERHTLIFTENTSAAINLLARMLPLTTRDVIAVSEIEHTSNNLPWRYNTPAQVVEFAADRTGRLDFASLERLLAVHGDAVNLIAVSGASNQTGHVPDLARLARLAHARGALLFVDAAQLAPHRPIDMRRDGIDVLAFSAHKVYAPFGLGVLALPSALLDVMPVNPGGGSIDMISDRGVVWSPARERHQTGTWNATGIVALAASCRALQAAGWARLIEHEQALMAYAAEALAAVPGLVSHVPLELYAVEGRLGAFPFNIRGLHHALVAAALEHEHAIEVRAGTICNHRLVRQWFAVGDPEQAEIERRVQAGDRLASYGIVRASLGLGNNREDVDRLAAALTELSTHGTRLRYRPDFVHETFAPEDPPDISEDRR